MHDAQLFLFFISILVPSLLLSLLLYRVCVWVSDIFEHFQVLVPSRHPRTWWWFRHIRPALRPLGILPPVLPSVSKALETEHGC